jgi:hypothetical protein
MRAEIARLTKTDRHMVAATRAEMLVGSGEVTKTDH